MTSLSNIAANQACRDIISKSDNILADLQKLNLPNDIVYSLMVGATAWCVQIYNDGASGLENIETLCIKAKTREEEIRIFVDTVPSWVIVSNIATYFYDRPCDNVIADIYNKYHHTLNQILRSERDNKYKEIIAVNKEYIIQLYINAKRDYIFRCFELKFNVTH
jgi:hypothetical protein